MNAECRVRCASSDLSARTRSSGPCSGGRRIRGIYGRSVRASSTGRLDDVSHRAIRPHDHTGSSISSPACLRAAASSAITDHLERGFPGVCNTRTCLMPTGARIAGNLERLPPGLQGSMDRRKPCRSRDLIGDRQGPETGRSAQWAGAWKMAMSWYRTECRRDARDLECRGAGSRRSACCRRSASVCWPEPG